MILGFVTKTGTPSTYFSQSSGNQGSTGGTSWMARKTDGTNMGSYQSLGEAQRAIERAVGGGVGGGQNISWSRQDMNGGIEQWVIIGEPFTPLEIWGDDLAAWIEPSYAPGSVQQSNVTTGKVSQVSDLSPESVIFSEATVANQPTISTEAATFKGRERLVFDNALSQLLTAAGSDAAALLTPPFTVIQVANYDEAPFLIRYSFVQRMPFFSLGVSAAGLWEMNNGALITGGAASTAPAVLSAVQTATAGRFRVNGTAIGSNASGIAAAGTPITMGGSAGVEYWPGGISMLVIARTADADDVRLVKTERWAASRY